MTTTTPAQLRLSLDEETAQALANNAVVAIGTSGGKDSGAAAIQTMRFLDRIGHAGTRLLIHADLGLIEHTDSLPHCEKLADFLQIPLIIVQRKKGGLIERWEERWASNWRRYCNLKCVTVISPSSSSIWKFCTSETKVQPITQELTRQFPKQQIINVVGIRREESAERAKRPISTSNPRLTRANGTNGRDWHPILNWTTKEVL